MTFYKMEAIYRVVTANNKPSKKTYRYYFNNYPDLIFSLNCILKDKATTKIKTISEEEYVRGIR